MDTISRRRRPRRALRYLRVAGFVVLLAGMTAAPALALALAQSSTTYDFATSTSQGAAGDWHRTGQTISITVTPTVDNTATCSFSSDGGVHWTLRTADATGTAQFQFAVADEGANTIVFYGSDTSEATEAVAHEPGYVNLDFHSPVTTDTAGLAAGHAQTSDAHWSQETTRPVSMTAVDPPPSNLPSALTSGVKLYRWRVNGESFSEETVTAGSVGFTLVKGTGGVVEGANTLEYQAVDWAGNREATQTAYVNIDTVEPTTTPSPALATNRSSDWFAGSVEVTLNWADVSSGVPPYGTWYWIDDGNLSLYSVPFVVSGEGSTKLTYRSTDRAGNVEATQTAYVNIDSSAPLVSYTVSPASDSGWYKSDATVAIQGEDAVSGIQKTQYREQLDVLPDWTDAAGDEFVAPASANATLTYEVRSVDNAGNVSLPETVVLKMDSVLPKTAAKKTSGVVGTRIKLQYRITDKACPKATSVRITIKNARGGVVKKYDFGTRKKNTGTWYALNWTPANTGTFTYYVYAADLAGNKQQTPVGSATIKVRKR